MKIRTALLVALMLSGCRNLSYQDDRTIVAIEPFKSQFINPVASDKLTSSDEDDDLEVSNNLWVRIAQDMRLEIPNNHQVNTQRNMLLRNSNHMSTIANRAEPYLYLIVEEIEQRGLPMELITIPMIESMFDPNAQSNRNAVGLWQMMPTTGKSFGLHSDSWYDGRRDVIASTRAALDYLEYLNHFFDGDWLLTFAAYNAGEGRVKNAIARNKRAGRPTDFWSLDLPRQTQLYVPKILAIASVLSQADDINLPVLANEPKLRLIETNGQLDLNVAAKLAGVKTSQLKAVNPALSRGVVSASGPHQLLVPLEYADTLELALASLPKSKRTQYSGYKVAAGDTLSRIAQKHGTTVADIKLANNLRSHTIRLGQQLNIPSSASKVVKTATGSSYKVKSGDSLWSISKAHGISYEQLAQLNDLKTTAQLKPGMVLKVNS